MNLFRYKLALRLIAVGTGAGFLAIVALSFFDGGLLRLLALALIGICIVGYGINASHRLVKPLVSSTEKFDKLICGESVEGTTGESELPELKRIRKAINLLVSEQLEAKRKLEAMVGQLEESKQDLIETNGFLEAVFESAPVGILVVEKDGTYISSNNRLRPLLGWEGVEEANIEDQFCRAFTEPGRCRDLWNKGIQQPSCSLEYEGATECEDARQLHVFSAPVRNSKGEIFSRVWIVRDDTERHVLNESLQQSQKMEAIGLLAGGIAHDFNNLLTAIRGNLEFVLSDPDLELEEETTNRLGESFEATKTASSLVSQILGYSRKTKLKIEPTCINTIARSTCKLVSRMMGANMQIVPEIPDTSCRAKAEPTKIQQILVNLCVNSRDAMASQGGKITIAVTEVEFDAPDCESTRFQERRPGKYIRLTVTDTGEGIKEEHLPRIFDPFFTTKPTGKGTGLGLSTCYGIAVQHAGWIECESEPGTGTTFHVYLPFLDNKTPDCGKTQRTGNGEATFPGDREIGTILVVDDEACVRKIANLSLKRKGYHVVDAEGGPQAIEYFRTNADSVEMILLDRNMPDMTGEEVYRELIRIKPDVKVVVCSGFLIDLEEFATEDGCIPEGFLQKPYALNELVDTVNRTIRGEVILPR